MADSRCTDSDSCNSLGSDANGRRKRLQKSDDVDEVHGSDADCRRKRRRRSDGAGDVPAMSPSFDPWDDAVPSCSIRYPGLEGSMLLSVLRRVYVLPNKKHYDSWFTESGKRRFRRHPRNKRNQEGTRRKYKSLIIQHGLLQGLRSELMAIEVIENGEVIAYFIAGATLIEGAYDAIDCLESLEKPQQVQFMMKQGLKDVSIVDERTPPDVIYEFVDTLNTLNGIAGQTSHIELYDKVPSIEKAFMEKRKADRKRQDAVNQDCKPKSYEVEYKEFVMKSHGKAFNSSFEFFKETKKSRHAAWRIYANTFPGEPPGSPNTPHGDRNVIPRALLPYVGLIRAWETQ